MSSTVFFYPYRYFCSSGKVFTSDTISFISVFLLPGSASSMLIRIKEVSIKLTRIRNTAADGDKNHDFFSSDLGTVISHSHWLALHCDELHGLGQPEANVLPRIRPAVRGPVPGLQVDRGPGGHLQDDQGQCCAH